MTKTTTLRSEVVLPQTLDSGSADDWRRAATAGHNILVEGPEAAVRAVLRLLVPRLLAPVTWQPRGIPLAFPVDECGALVLQNIAGLDAHDQARLRAWLDEPTHRTQVVSVTPYPLLPLVDCSAFDATLYYRLNTVRFFVGQG